MAEFVLASIFAGIVVATILTSVGIFRGWFRGTRSISPAIQQTAPILQEELTFESTVQTPSMASPQEPILSSEMVTDPEITQSLGIEHEVLEEPRLETVMPVEQTIHVPNHPEVTTSIVSTSTGIVKDVVASDTITQPAMQGEHTVKTPRRTKRSYKSRSKKNLTLAQQAK